MASERQRKWQRRNFSKMRLTGARQTCKYLTEVTLEERDKLNIIIASLDAILEDWNNQNRIIKKEE